MLTWETILKRSESGNLPANKRVEKTDLDWEKILTPEQFYITRQSGTEKPFSSDSCSYFEPGEYACVCCDELLFGNDSQFNSGTGWPSFMLPAAENAIDYYPDNSLDRFRIETKCSSCDAHLGHVFPDGPEPTGLRYCMNAIAIKKL